MYTRPGHRQIAATAIHGSSETATARVNSFRRTRASILSHRSKIRAKAPRQTSCRACADERTIRESPHARDLSRPVRLIAGDVTGGLPQVQGMRDAIRLMSYALKQPVGR